MFYSSKEFVAAVTQEVLPSNMYVGDVNVLHQLREGRAPKREFGRLFREVKQAIIHRQSEFVFDSPHMMRNGYPSPSTRVYVGKWFRPWDVVTSLRTFRPPAGDFGIGIEVEMGFRSRQDCSNIVAAIANWRNITVDYEGGNYPAEVTFPPTLYSKYGSNSQASRYLKLLAANSSVVHPHDEHSMVGTHVNVSVGDGTLDALRVAQVRGLLTSERDNADFNRKYFGRAQPYGYLNLITENNNHRIEHKMFNSTTDWRRLRQYVDVAVSLTALVRDAAVVITSATVLAALEEGYNKHPIKESNNV